MKVFSTFSGIGGFEIGIQNAYRSTHRVGSSRTSANQEGDWKGLLAAQGEDSDTTQGSVSASTDGLWLNERPLFVGYSEIDKFATKVYQRQFEGSRNYGDITKINADTLPDFDCLVGGFPCQAFSIAGRRGGFDDTRGTLFFDLARILRTKQPRLFVFENVKGLLNHDDGRTFATIIQTIDELGYDCQWQVLNSKNHRVPQNRERVIIVGHLRGTPRPQVFPFVENDSGSIGWEQSLQRTVRTEESDGVGDDNTRRLPQNGADGYIHQLNSARHDYERIYDTSGIAPTINTGQRGNAQPKVLVPEATKKGYAEASVGQSINLSVMGSKTRRGRVSDVAQTLDTNMQQHTLTPDSQIRRLTPLECERLQGFPDNWTKYGEDEHGVRIDISDTQRYKMCGNAVTTNVIQDVFERIFNKREVNHVNA